MILIHDQGIRFTQINNYRNWSFSVVFTKMIDLSTFLPNQKVQIKKAEIIIEGDKSYQDVTTFQNQNKHEHTEIIYHCQEQRKDIQILRTHCNTAQENFEKFSKTQSKVVKRSINRVTTIVGTLLCKRLILFCSEIWNFEKILENFFLSSSEISDLLQHG